MIDPSTAIELVVTAALKAASSEVVKKSIGALSSRLGAAVESRNHAEVKKVIEEENLIEPIAEIARLGIERSVVFSLNSSDLLSPTYKTELFSRVVELGFRVSTENKVDVLLSGSLIDANTISLFSTQKYVPSLKKDGVSLFIQQSSFPSAGFYSILPSNSKSKELVEIYKTNVKEARDESLSNYIPTKRIAKEDSWAYAVNRVTAGSVYFNYSSNAAEISEKCIDDRVKISDFTSGIKSMLEGVRDYPSIPRLSQKEKFEIEALLEEIKNLEI